MTGELCSVSSTGSHLIHLTSSSDSSNSVKKVKQKVV